MTLHCLRVGIIAALMGSAFTVQAESAAVIDAPPISYKDVFNKQMDNPLVMVYEAERMYGLGDHDTALKWYLKAATFMNAPAIENAKWMIQKNQGVFANRTEVVDFLSYHGTANGDSQGDLYAQLYLADVYSGASCVWTEYRDNMHAGECSSELASAEDFDRSYYWYTLASYQGNTRAFYSVGMMDALGLGASRNIAKAVRMLERVAETYHANSAHILGKIFKTGYWLAQDQEVAVKWLTKAAELNHPEAMLDLADNYKRANGVELDNPEDGALVAIKWYDEVTKSLLSSPKQKAKAYYEKGLLQLTRHNAADPVEGVANLQRAVNVSEDAPNVDQVAALIRLASLAAEQSHEEALSLYEQAERLLDNMGDKERNRFASVYQSIAQIYASSELGVEKDLHQFSSYMKRYHAVRSKEVMESPSKDSLFGYGAFDY